MKNNNAKMNREGFLKSLFSTAVMTAVGGIKAENSDVWQKRLSDGILEIAVSMQSRLSFKEGRICGDSEFESMEREMARFVKRFRSENPDAPESLIYIGSFAGCSEGNNVGLKTTLGYKSPVTSEWVILELLIS